MQIILQEDIEKLGHRGDVVTVKPGYARNFLLPRKLAVEASTGNLKAIEKIRASLAKKTATEMEAAQKQAAALNGVELSFTRKTGENDQLFGSVTTGDIAEALEAKGFKIDKRQIHTAEPMKALGDFRATVKVFRDVTAELKIQVQKEQQAQNAELLRKFGCPTCAVARGVFDLSSSYRRKYFLQQGIFSPQKSFPEISEAMHRKKSSLSVDVRSHLPRTMRFIELTSFGCNQFLF